MDMKRIFLIGYMGAGKTTIGKELAKHLSLSFIDLDAYIQSKYRKTIAEIFDNLGEKEFRKIEKKTLNEVSLIEDVVISTGGGAPCFFDNMEVMNNAGVTVYIEAEPEELASRLLASKTVRPLIAGKSKEELIPFISEHLKKRERYYNKAQIVYHTDRMISKDEVNFTVSGLEELLRNIIAK